MNHPKDWSKLRIHDYHLVFLDLKMPDMDGVEVFKRIKEVKPSLPVTIITGYPESDLMKRALTYGPLGIMNKPFSASDILTVINNYLYFGEQLISHRKKSVKKSLHNQSDYKLKEVLK